jgi:hypothetical protein
MYNISETVRTSHGQDGAVILDIQRGRVIRLNVTASFILQCIERGESESQIAGRIAQHFRISHDVAQTDVGDFLRSMKQEGLVHPSTSLGSL